jgi:general stress protein 26
MKSVLNYHRNTPLLKEVLMEKSEILSAISEIIDDEKTALFATVSLEGTPAVRWVTPALLRGRAGAIYMVAGPRSNKIKHVRKNPDVQWSFQTRALDTIITVEGKVNVVDNPSIRSEVLEIVGPRLRAFWQMNMDERDLLVLETIMEKAIIYRPMKGEKEAVAF